MINRIKSNPALNCRVSFLLVDLILYIPFPRVRGKVGWGRPD
jgi:hypothetical protein